MLTVVLSGCMFSAVFTQMQNASAQTTENFTVSFATMDFVGEQGGKINGVNTTGTPILKIKFDGVTNEEIVAALDLIDDSLYLDGTPATELGGAHYFVNGDVADNTVSINLPDVKFYGNFTGTNWDYALEKFDYGLADPYEHLQNYKIELKAGLTIGGKTLAEDYARYYNNIAHIFTETAVQPGSSADMQFTNIRVSDDGSCVDLFFDQNLISQQIQWYKGGSDADLTATLVNLYNRVNNSDSGLYISEEEFAAAVVMPAAKSLHEDIHFSYTDMQGEKVTRDVKDTGGDVHYIKDAQNESNQWISVYFSEQNKIDVSKPIFVTVDGGFIAPSGASVQEDSQLIWDGTSVTYPVMDFVPTLSADKIAVSETAQISLAYTPENGYVEDVEFTSKDTGIATVSDEGVVTAMAQGETQITVKVLPWNIEKTVDVVVIAEQSLNVEVEEGYSPEQGDLLDKSKFTAKVTMSDNSVRDVASDELEIIGYDAQKTGKQTLTVKYGTLTDTVEITVKEKPVVLETIAATVAQDYSPEVGQDLDYSKFTLTLKYSDGSERTVAVTSDMVSGYNKDVAGEQTLTIVYEDKSATVKITVKEEPVILETIVATVAQDYSPEVGQDLDYSKFTLTLKYSDGSERTVAVTSDMVSGYNKDVAGEQTLTIVYEDKSATVKITVQEVQETQESGCNGAVSYGTFALCGAVLFAAAAIVVIKRVKSR